MLEEIIGKIKFGFVTASISLSLYGCSANSNYKVVSHYHGSMICYDDLSRENGDNKKCTTSQLIIKF